MLGYLRMVGNLTRKAARPVGHLTFCNDYLFIIDGLYIDAKFAFKARKSLNIKFESCITEKKAMSGNVK